MTPHIFAGNPLDRGEAERRDEKWLADRARQADSCFLPMHNLNVLVNAGPPAALAWLDYDEVDALNTDAEPVFLGLLDGKAHFVADVSDVADARRVLASGGRRFEDCRSAAERMVGPQTGIIAQARAQLDWHNRHGHCSVCGERTNIGRGGQVRRCPSCRAEHFPRTDPVVITVVTDGDRCLLGQSRGRLQQMKMYSALAGFMDQGENIEEAVAREIMEEAGIAVKNVRYHSSQPWPFPSSLMIGCHAEAATTDIAMDPEEMTDVQWFDRAEVLLALEGKSDVLAVPGPIAIAHHLIKAWANGQTQAVATVPRNGPRMRPDSPLPLKGEG